MSEWPTPPLGSLVEAIVPARDKPVSLDGSVPWVRIEDFNGKYIGDSLSGQGVSDYTIRSMPLRVFPAGTVACTCSCSMGTTAIVTKPLVTNQTFIGLVPRPGITSDFLYWALQGHRDRLTASSNGAIQSYLSKNDFRSLRIPVPAVAVQKAIANYLDRETARIDALIAAKRRMVELLAIKRRTLITRYVMRGCSQGATLKDSGLPWLREIPSRWQLAKFTRVVSIAEGQIDPESEPYRTMPLIAPNHIESGTGILLNTDTASDQGAISGKYLCQASDVIYSKIRPALRKAVLAPHACLCSADMYPLQAGDDLDPAYLLYFLLADPFSHWAELESERVAMPKINRESLSDLRIPIPSIEEQRRIVACISKETLELDKLRMATERSISLLQERRQALITAAVTGQIDTREAA